MVSSLDQLPKLGRYGKYNKHPYKTISADITFFWSSCNSQTRSHNLRGVCGGGTWNMRSVRCAKLRTQGSHVAVGWAIQVLAEWAEGTGLACGKGPSRSCPHPPLQKGKLRPAMRWNLDVFLVIGLGHLGIDLSWKWNEFLHSFARTAIFLHFKIIYLVRPFI